ncbi:hypothetical protein GCM10028864_57150 [Microlunatus parietis]
MVGHLDKGLMKDEPRWGLALRQAHLRPHRDFDPDTNNPRTAPEHPTQPNTQPNAAGACGGSAPA